MAGAPRVGLEVGSGSRGTSAARAQRKPCAGSRQRAIHVVLKVGGEGGTSAPWPVGSCSEPGGRGRAYPPKAEKPTVSSPSHCCASGAPPALRPTQKGPKTKRTPRSA